MRRSKLIYHPLAVLVYSGLGIILYVAFMRRRYPGGDLSHNFFYVLPIIVPFVAFVVDRARKSLNAGLIEFAIDIAVVVTAIIRALGGVPLVSGHALFLTYAIARPGTRLTRITAAIVMVQVIYLKLFVWHDLISPVTGAALGLLAAFIVRRLPRRATSLPLRPLPDIQ
jgi:hypothetical protein